MKRFNWISLSFALGAWLCFAAPVWVLTSCTTSQQTKTFNTLYSVEKSTVAAYDAYLDLFLAGKIKTNGVPAVSRAFNDFQSTMQVALLAARFQTNAPVTPQVATAALRVTNAIEAAKAK